MYYIEKNVNMPIEKADEKVREALKEVGFGIITEIDMQATLKKKIDKDIKPYKILGACNPNFAYQAIQEEEKIGIMLPCNVPLIDNGDGTTNVAVMNPVTALSIVGNDKIIPFAEEVKVLLEKALNSL
ncbi:MAG TPA: hypothetical protein DIU39_05760 [Flavobacteriales bacterium]|nr:hypothetical protein [Flavobacteriales bacterium]